MLQPHLLKRHRPQRIPPPLIPLQHMQEPSTKQRAALSTSTSDHIPSKPSKLTNLHHHLTLKNLIKNKNHTCVITKQHNTSLHKIFCKYVNRPIKTRTLSNYHTKERSSLLYKAQLHAQKRGGYKSILKNRQTLAFVMCHRWRTEVKPYTKRL